MRLLLAQIRDSMEPIENGPPPEYYTYEPSLWDSFWFAASGWMGLIYFAFLIWMIIYCVKNDPERYIWLLVIFLIQPLGPFIYFLFRWLPSSDIKLPAFTQQWTQKRELLRLETAARQIGNAHQHVQYGDALKKVGKHTEALAAYQLALAKESKNLAALWGASSMEFKTSQFESAREHLSTVLEIEEGYKFGDVSLLYGKTLGALEQYPEALNHLEKHVRKWRQPEAMFLLANLYLRDQQPAKARDTLQSLILDIDSSPRSIARKHLFWKSRAKKQLRKLA